PDPAAPRGERVLQAKGGRPRALARGDAPPPGADRRRRLRRLYGTGSLGVMQLEGIHHVTAITGDARRNVDFYARVLGLRLVKKTVNQDDPTVYHLFYADEQGDAGSYITFFEYPGAAPGRAGDGMIHRVGWRVGSAEALDFWAERLAGEGGRSERDGDRLRFA